MAIRSILTAYSGEAESCGALDLGLLMARRFDAWLTAVAWHGPSIIESRYGGLMSRGVRSMLAERDAGEIATIKAEFEAHAAGHIPADRARFLDLAGVSDFSLAVCARGYDVVVMTRHAPAAGREHFSAWPDTVALRSGRPVIVAPTAGGAEAFNDAALIAWDGHRAAARAVADAMHLLRAKTRVTVLSIGKEAPEEGPGDGIMTLLARHGVAAERMVRPAGKGGVSATILDACRETGAGLLVMGAYEHSRFTEELIGGVTRDILTDAHLPVLMSH